MVITLGVVTQSRELDVINTLEPRSLWEARMMCEHVFLPTKLTVRQRNLRFSSLENAKFVNLSSCFQSENTFRSMEMNTCCFEVVNSPDFIAAYWGLIGVCCVKNYVLQSVSLILLGIDGLAGVSVMRLSGVHLETCGLTHSLTHSL